MFSQAAKSKNNQISLVEGKKRHRENPKENPGIDVFCFPQEKAVHSDNHDKRAVTNDYLYMLLQCVKITINNNVVILEPIQLFWCP